MSIHRIDDEMMRAFECPQYYERDGHHGDVVSPAKIELHYNMQFISVELGTPSRTVSTTFTMTDDDLIKMLGADRIQDLGRQLDAKGDANKMQAASCNV